MEFFWFVGGALLLYVLLVVLVGIRIMKSRDKITSFDFYEDDKDGET
jgi:hypothetical protein